jgi:hypothetical protein
MQQIINNHYSFMLGLVRFMKLCIVVLELFHFLTRVIIEIGLVFLLLKTVRFLYMRSISRIRYTQCLNLSGFS